MFEQVSYVMSVSSFDYDEILFPMIMVKSSLLIPALPNPIFLATKLGFLYLSSVGDYALLKL